MDWWNEALRVLIAGYGALFGDLPPFVSLTVLSFLIGIGMLWVVAKVSNQEAIRQTKKHLQACLLELRLFGDEPALLWKSQKNLLRINLRYLGLMVRPVLILSLPITVLLFHLDSFYGLSPLPVGKPALVTVQSIEPVSANTPVPRLAVTKGFAVETSAVRVVEQSQFTWRIRPLEKAVGKLYFNWGDVNWEKTITSTMGAENISSRRVRSLLDALWHPGEDRLHVQYVEWVEVSYPSSVIEIGAIGVDWLVWFLVISIASAYLVKGYFNVAL